MLKPWKRYCKRKKQRSVARERLVCLIYSCVVVFYFVIHRFQIADIVVDNGAASAYAQLSSLVTVFPHMQNRGLYIITDVRTATFVRSLVAQLEHNSKGGSGVAQLPYIADHLSANMSLTDSVADSISQSLAL